MVIRNLRLLMVCSLLAVVSSANYKRVYAADWQLEPRVDASALYTDNVDAKTDQEKQSDLITEINPGFSLNRQGARIGVSLNYDYKARFYAGDNDRNNTNHAYNASGDVELVKQHLYVTGSSSLSQRTVDPMKSLSVDNTTLTGNRGDVWAASAGGRWQSKLGRFARTQMQYTINRTDVEGNALGDTGASQLNGVLHSGPSLARFSWLLQYNQSESNNQNSAGLSSKTAYGQAGYALTRKIILSLRLGYEENPKLQRRGSPQEGTTKEAILTLRPTSRLSMVSSYGRRSFGETYNVSTAYQTSRTILQGSFGRGPFGDTYSATVNRRGRRSELGLVYVESQTNRSFLALGQAQIEIPGGQQNISPNIDNNQDGASSRTIDVFFPVVKDETFIRKFGQLSGKLKGRRNELSNSFFYERREFSESLVTDSSYGGDVSWRLVLNRRSDFKVTTSRQRINLSQSSRHDNVSQISAQYSHLISRDIKISLDYRHLRRDASDDSADQRENRVRATMQVTL